MTPGAWFEEDTVREFSWWLFWDDGCYDSWGWWQGFEGIVAVLESEDEEAVGVVIELDFTGGGYSVIFVKSLLSSESSDEKFFVSN